MINFIIVDDDILSNRIVQMSLIKYCENAVVKSFSSASDALNHIRDKVTETNLPYPTVILLDINMPVMNGWEFLEKYEQLNETIRSEYCIYLFSSSIDATDIERSKQIHSVQGYVVKPLLKDKILELTEALKSSEYFVF